MNSYSIAVLFHGRLFQTDMERQAVTVPGSNRRDGRPYQDAGPYLEARHIFLQRAGVVPSHHHHAQQTAADQTGWYRALLNEVKCMIDSRHSVWYTKKPCMKKVCLKKNYE